KNEQANFSSLRFAEPGFKPLFFNKKKPRQNVKFCRVFSWRRERDSNPRCRKDTLVFETSQFNHSCTSPYLLFYHERLSNNRCSSRKSLMSFLLLARSAR